MDTNTQLRPLQCTLPTGWRSATVSEVIANAFEKQKPSQGRHSNGRAKRPRATVAPGSGG